MSVLEGLPPMEPIEAGRQILFVRRWGSGPRMLLLHGGPGLDHHLLLPLARRLARRCEIWLPDLPGHGRSRQPGRGLPDLSTLILRTAAWIDDLSPPPAILVGHSLGGWIVRQLLREHRVEPRAAVLVAPPVPTPSVPSKMPGPKRPGRTVRRSVLGLRAEIERLAGIEDGEPGFAELQETLSASRLHPLEDYEGLRGQMRRSFAGVPAMAPNEIPLLLLFGEEDPLTPRSGIERLSRLTPGARTEVVAGAGHFPFLDRGEGVADVVLRFLDEHGALAPGLSV